MPEPCRRLQSKHHRERSRNRASHRGLAVTEMLNRKDMPVQLSAGPGAAAGGLAAFHFLQHIGAAASGRLHLQDLGALLPVPLQDTEQGFKLFNLGIDPGPLLPERFQLPFEALGVHAVLCVLFRR